MRRVWLIVGGMAVGLMPGTAAAQTLTPPTTTGVSPWVPTVRAGVTVSPFAPNFYNRQQQPLSPYLNLLRGLDPATNYYYGARPGLPTGNPPAVAAPVAPAGSQLRTGFLPAAANPTQETIELPGTNAEIPSLPPSGHPVVYGGGPGGSMMGRRPGVFGNQPPPAFNRKGGSPKTGRAK